MLSVLKERLIIEAKIILKNKHDTDTVGKAKRRLTSTNENNTDIPFFAWTDWQNPKFDTKLC